MGPSSLSESGESSGGTRTQRSGPCEGPEHDFLSLPEEFRVQRYADADGLGGGEFRPGPEPGPRMLGAYGGTIYVSIPEQGRVVALPDEDDSGAASRVVTILSDVELPHGIQFHEDWLYVALATSVVRYRMDGMRVDRSSKEVLLDGIPKGDVHWTRSIAIHDSRVYLSAGACISNCSGGNDRYLAAITSFDLDGSNPKTFATGLRNAVGIGWHDGNLFATENATEGYGPDLPPDEINVVKPGRDYGYPECFGDNIPAEASKEVDGTATPPGPCAGRATPAVNLQAHSAPLGFDFGTTTAFPETYRGDMYVALHGSWAREDPVGYKVVRVPYDGSLGNPRDFVIGWMPEGGSNEDARGRPVDVLVHDDAMYVSDDKRGAIYRICYRG